MTNDESTGNSAAKTTAAKEGTAPKFRRRKDARPDEILDAALTLFSKQGFAGTTVDQIARKAGVSKGAVYLYFTSKDAIAEALVDRAVGAIAEAVVETVHSYQGDPRQMIRRIAEMVKTRLAVPQTVAVPKFIIHESSGTPGLAQIYAEKVILKVMPAMIALFRQGMDGGYIRKLDPEMLTRSLMGPVFMHLLLSEVFDIRPKQGLDLDGLFDTHLDVFFAGLEPVSARLAPKEAPNG